MSGHPGIDLAPGLFEPGPQPIRRWNISSWDHNDADEQTAGEWVAAIRGGRPSAQQPL